MEKVNFSKYIEDVKFHVGTLARGLGRTIYGALTSGILAIAVYGFFLIKGESGYAAVFDFVASCATLFVALCNVYVMGRKKIGAKK